MSLPPIFLKRASFGDSYRRLRELKPRSIQPIFRVNANVPPAT
jgi:hypothetical protein